MTRSLGFGLAMMLGFAALGFAGCGGTGESKSPASNPDSKTPARKLCKFPGIRYIGSTDQGGAVCFTLTADGKRLLEVDFYSTTSCGDGRDASTLVFSEYEGVLPELGAHGVVELKIPFYDGQQQVAELLFRGALRGAAASGVITNKGFCESLKVKWIAHRRSKR
jgi:hypothetical protein